MFLGVKSNLGVDGTPAAPTYQDEPCCGDKKAISVSADSMIKQRAVYVVLVGYAKYLLKTGIISDKDAVAKEVGKIASAAMDAGSFDAGFLQCLLEHIKSKCRIDSPSEEIRQCVCEMREHLMKGLVCELEYDEAVYSTLTDEEQKLLKTATEAWRTYCDAKWRVEEMFQSSIDAAICNVLETYKNMFDAGFASAFCKK